MAEGMSDELSASFEAARAASLAAHAARQPEPPASWVVEVPAQRLEFPSSAACLTAVNILRTIGVTGRRLRVRP